MAAMEMAPETRAANNHALEMQQVAKHQGDKLLKEEGTEKALDEYI